MRNVSDKRYFNPLNSKLNPICHLLALLGAHHILHVSRMRVKGHFNPLNAKLNPICHLLALLGAHHILHVSRIRVKGHFNPLNTKLNPICHLLALLGAHHILHVSRIWVKNQNTHFVFNNLFFLLKSCRLWDNVAKHGRAGRAKMTIWYRACASHAVINKATDTHPDYVNNSFPRQQW